MTALPHPPSPRPDAHCPHGGDPWSCGPCLRARHVPADLPERLVVYARFTARFDQRCGLCDAWIREGDDAATVGEDFDSRVVAHRACAEEA